MSNNNNNNFADVPAQWKAQQIDTYGPPSHFVLREVSKPANIPADCFAVKIHYAGLNPVDAKIRSGNLSTLRKTKLPITLGFDFSGTIIAAGAKTSKFKVGDEVLGICAADFNAAWYNGSFGEISIVPESRCLRKIPELSHRDAAAVGIPFATACDGLFLRGKMTEKSRVFITGGSGGVGHVAIRLAKKVGAFVGTSCSSKNVEFVKKMGADFVVDYTTEKLSEATEKDFDIFFDCVGGDEFYYDACKILKKKGIFITISGPQQHIGSTPVTYGDLLSSVASAVKHKVASMFGNGPTWDWLTEPSPLAMTLMEKMLAEGVLPEVTNEFEFEQMKEAHEMIETHRAVGKIVIKILQDEKEEKKEEKEKKKKNKEENKEEEEKIEKEEEKIEKEEEKIEKEEEKIEKEEEKIEKEEEKNDEEIEKEKGSSSENEEI